MRIGIDVSQAAFKGVGVSNYLLALIESLVVLDSKNQFVLFFSSLRQEVPKEIVQLAKRDNVEVKTFKFPLALLEILWNRIHKVPIERFIGNIDIFISSDWTQPPVKNAKKATILYDLIIYKYPRETAPKIVQVQKRRLKWVRKEVDEVFCISEATRKDASDILNIDKKKLAVLYPGI